jgi:predicted RNase H-like HicB family nuclease
LEAIAGIPVIETVVLMRCAIVIERRPTTYGAYVPDLPGCVAAADTREEVVKLIREAIDVHLEGMRNEKLEIPNHHPVLSTSKLRSPSEVSFARRAANIHCLDNHWICRSCAD